MENKEVTVVKKEIPASFFTEGAYWSYAEESYVIAIAGRA